MEREKGWGRWWIGVVGSNTGEPHQRGGGKAAVTWIEMSYDTSEEGGGLGLNRSRPLYLHRP
jgi:hypothetical protein